MGASKLIATLLALVVGSVEMTTFFDARHDLSSLMALAMGFTAFLLTATKSHHKRWYPVLVYPLTAAATYWMAGYGVWATLALWVVDMVCNRHKNRYYLMAWMLAFALTSMVAWIATEACTMSGRAAVTTPGIGSVSMPDFDLENDFAAYNNHYFGREQSIIATVEQSKNPSPLQTLFYNMAVAKEGRLPDILLSHQPTELGTLYSIGPTTPKLIINTMSDLYWTLGDMTYAERAALMASTFSPRNHNVRMIKRMAEVNLVTGDTLAACKFLDILANTLAYRTWAVNHHPATMTEAVKQQIIDKRQWINTMDTLRIGDHCRTILRELVQSNIANIVALDYLLCTDLQICDLPAFKSDYDQFCMANDKPRLKPLYQQALCICLEVEQADLDTWKRYIKLPEVLTSWRSYNDNPTSAIHSGTYWRYYDSAPKKDSLP
ncbi:MAG: hypothetical protein IKH19_02590 [Muribaculaceae bacterium]|nr:hypothetical protein [Muribaculaceae bacterium]